MADADRTTSRRAFVKAIAVTSCGTLVHEKESSGEAIAAIVQTDQLVALRRTSQGRRDSRFRYHNAESFFRIVEHDRVRNRSDQLYQTGIVLQLGLSSHLFDVGFSDAWCARHIGLDISRSLACANATGLGFDIPEFDLLAASLSPYGKWRLVRAWDGAEDPPFTLDQIRALTRALLNHVHHVTGHPRPRGWQVHHG